MTSCSIHSKISFPLFSFINLCSWIDSICHEISSVVIKFHTTHIPGLTRVPNILSKLESSSRFINLVMERVNACVCSQWKSRKAPISLSALLIFFPFSAMKSAVIKFVLNYSLSFCFAFGFFLSWIFVFIEISPTCMIHTMKKKKKTSSKSQEHTIFNLNCWDVNLC